MRGLIEKLAKEERFNCTERLQSRKTSNGLHRTALPQWKDQVAPQQCPQARLQTVGYQGFFLSFFSNDGSLANVRFGMASTKTSDFQKWAKTIQ